MRRISRRSFLGNTACAAMGSTTLVSTLLNLRMANAAATQSALFNTDYRAMVCVLFAGGIDSYNLLVPRGVPEYLQYHLSRTSLALPQEALLPVFPKTTAANKIWGLHPSLSGVQQLFENEEVAFMANVGTLQEPIADVAEFRSGTKRRPLGLFSHSDQIMQWQTSVPRDRSAVGWGGRMADILSDPSCYNSNISMNISLAGRNVFQGGKKTGEYSIRNTGNGSIGIDGYQPTDPLDAFTMTVDSLLDAEYQNLMRCTYANVVRESQDDHEEFSTAISMVNPFTKSFSNNNFSRSLEMAARTIAARDTLNMNRQIFYIVVGGWDHHDEVLANQLRMLKTINDGLVEFNCAMKELGVNDKVTLFTISDFARTLTTNGNGSDHAWGGIHFTMGGAVKGREIYGAFPELSLNSSLDLGRGRLIPTMSTDEYFAELALWFGVSRSDLSMVLPNITTFYADPVNNPAMPVGFMNM